MATTPTAGRTRPTKIEAMEVRLDPAEKQTFKDAAALAGVPVSSWVRDRLRRLARRELEEAGQPVAFLNGITLG